MKIILGADHAGKFYKDQIKKHLEGYGVDVEDVGTYTEESCDYPTYAIKVGEKIANKEGDFGIIVCGTGEGVCMAANKVKGVRCGIGYSDNAAKLMREHNDANVITFGQRLMTLDDVKRRVDYFINTKFANDRHSRRVNIITEYENR